MGTVLVMLLIFAMISSSCATQNGSCVNGDVEICSSIISNQISLSDVKIGMEELANTVTSQLLENNKDIKDLLTLLTSNDWKNALDGEDQATKLEELESCSTLIDDRKTQISDLEKKNQEASQRVQAKKDERDKLLQEIEDIKKSKNDLQENIRQLVVQIPQDKIFIGNLTWMSHIPMDCADLQLQGKSKSGVYTIFPYQNSVSVDVQCDFDSHGGAWTVFFTRMPQEVQEDFNTLWEKYKTGFGNVDTEYWIGNDFLHALTSYHQSTLRIDAEIFDGEKRWSEWNNFKVANEEDKYRLTLEDFQAVSTMGDSLSMNNQCKFTTIDNDNDEYTGVNCAEGSHYTIVGPGAWWYRRCGLTRPTGPLINTNTWLSACWQHWNPAGQKRRLVSFKILSMKFRRHNYEQYANVSN